MILVPFESTSRSRSPSSSSRTTPPKEAPTLSRRAFSASSPRKLAGSERWWSMIWRREIFRLVFGSFFFLSLVYFFLSFFLLKKIQGKHKDERHFLISFLSKRAGEKTAKKKKPNSSSENFCDVFVCVFLWRVSHRSWSVSLRRFSLDGRREKGTEEEEEEEGDARSIFARGPLLSRSLFEASEEELKGR